MSEWSTWLVFADDGSVVIECQPNDENPRRRLGIVFEENPEESFCYFVSTKPMKQLDNSIMSDPIKLKDLKPSMIEKFLRGSE